jgi:hypothetical protein
MGFLTSEGRFFVAADVDLVRSTNTLETPFFKRSVAFGKVKFVMLEIDPILIELFVGLVITDFPSGLVIPKTLPR